jgi:uncharacterized protein YuzE
MDMAPIIEYDAKVDILAVKWKENTRIKDEKVLDSDIVLEYDEKGELVGLEVWNASKRGLLKTLTDLAREKNEILELITRK